MRRFAITLSAGLMVLAIAPAGAMARHHHARHHSRVRHARIERFGRDTSTGTASPSSADNAGTASFQNGVLTLTMSDGSTVSGRVTGDTEIECQAPESGQTMHQDGDGGSGDQSGDGDHGGSGDNQPQGSDEQSSGEDQADAAEQNESQAEDQNENQAEDQNENPAGGDQNDNENQAENNNCSTSNLNGATVREAELRVTSAGSTWKKVELAS